MTNEAATPLPRSFRVLGSAFEWRARGGPEIFEGWTPRPFFTAFFEFRYRSAPICFVAGAAACSGRPPPYASGLPRSREAPVPRRRALLCLVVVRPAFANAPAGLPPGRPFNRAPGGPKEKGRTGARLRAASDPSASAQVISPSPRPLQLSIPFSHGSHGGARSLPASAGSCYADKHQVAKGANGADSALGGRRSEAPAFSEWLTWRVRVPAPRCLGVRAGSRRGGRGR